MDIDLALPANVVGEPPKDKTAPPPSTGSTPVEAGGIELSVPDAVLPKKYDKQAAQAAAGASDIPSMDDVRRNEATNREANKPFMETLGDLVSNKDGVLGKKAVGALETAASVGSGVLSSPLAVLNGIDSAIRYGDPKKFEEGFGNAADTFTYQPRTAEGRDMTGAAGDFMNRNLVPLGPLAELSAMSAMHAAAPKGSMSVKNLPGAIMDAGQDIIGGDAPAPAYLDRVAPGERPPPLRIEVQGTADQPVRVEPRLPVDAPADGTPPAGAAPAQAAPAAPPAPAVNPNVARNQALAERLGIRITPGQAAEDLGELSNEAALNHPDVRAMLDGQGTALTDALDAHRARVAGDFVDLDRNSMNEVGMDAVQQAANAREQRINSLYKTFEEANPQGVQINAQGVYENAMNTLMAKSLDQWVPDKWMNILRQHMPLTDEEQAAAAAGQPVRTPRPLTVSQWDQYRSQIARSMRSASDGNERAALGIVRDALENADMSGSEETRGLADAARAASRANFDARRASPAYDAIVNGEASASNFFDKHAFSKTATVEHLQALDRIMADNPNWQQMKTAATLAYLRERAVDPVTGALNPKSLGNAIRTLGPAKLNNLLGSDSIAHITDLIEAGRITKQRGVSSMGRLPEVANAPEAPHPPIAPPMGDPLAEANQRAVMRVGGAVVRRIPVLGDALNSAAQLALDRKQAAEASAHRAYRQAMAAHQEAMRSHAAELARLQEQARQESAARIVSGLGHIANPAPGVRMNGLGNMPSINRP